MTFQFVAIIIVVSYLRRAYHTKISFPVWNRRLLTIMFAGIACMILQTISSKINEELAIVFSLIEDILLGILLYIVYKQEEFKSVKFLLVAVGPYVILCFLDDLLQLPGEKFYLRVKKVDENILVFAVIWGIGVWLVTRKQQKELAKARAKAVEEESNNKVISAMKAQLEIQVAERTAELTKQKEELQLTVDELKSTQAQLIQSEKMASLGELTAGIAHEIQNPLNFVNNFSEVSNEMIDEMKEELATGNLELATEIANDIKQNLEKINHHGKRADAIVKGMLQHSRQSKGIKESTDINALCDEYLRLAYHGLRAKDKSFNTDFKTDFDGSISKINIVPQDIGRVLLNLYNNAFYAVNEKLTAHRSPLTDGYKPLVSIQTKKINDKVEIIVTDNGNGIPQNIVDKIFQPFFTTKPTGSGTGLGLSLSYDIIKAHGGEIKVESKDGEGSEFMIQLPLG
jgi:two-component system, NtrC family, sensor kinase